MVSLIITLLQWEFVVTTMVIFSVHVTVQITEGLNNRGSSNRKKNSSKLLRKQHGENERAEDSSNRGEVAKLARRLNWRTLFSRE